MFDHWDYNGGEYFPWDELTIEEDIVVTAAWRDFNGPLSLYEGHRYAFIPGSYNWETAEAICESMGGHLATVTSEAENDIVSLLAANGISWIGATYEMNRSNGSPAKR